MVDSELDPVCLASFYKSWQSWLTTCISPVTNGEPPSYHALARSRSVHVRSFGANQDFNELVGWLNIEAIHGNPIPQTPSGADHWQSGFNDILSMRARARARAHTHTST